MIGSGTKYALAFGIAGLGYVASNLFGEAAVNAFTTTQCHADMFTLTCATSAPERWTPGVFEAIAFTAIVVLGLSWLVIRDMVAFPFIAMMSVLALLALGYDGVVSRPILQEARIINDTMNVLGFVIFASFFLTFATVPQAASNLVSVAIAVVISFGAKVLTVCVFWNLQAHIMGATELFILFVVYAFGAFSIHLMAVSSMVRNTVAAHEPIRQQIYAAPRQGEGAVDGLRGVAILLMVVYHYVPPHFFSFSLGKPINSILFVVAGYFFASTLLKHSRQLNQPFSSSIPVVAEMLVRRHIRIWPVLALVVGLYFALSVVDPSPLTHQIHDTWFYYVSYLGYVPRWIHEGQTFPPHLWAVSAQEGLILVLSIASLLFGVTFLRQHLWILVAVGIVCRFFATLFLMPEHPSMALETPLSILDPLALGMMARFELDRRGMGSQLRRNLIVTLIGAMAIWVILPNWNATYFTFAPFITAVTTALIMVISSDDVRGARLAAAGLAHPILIMLGRMSLSAFLLHPFVNTVIRLIYTRYTGVEIAWWLLFLIGPVISFGVAWVFWRIIEEPLRQLKSQTPRKAARAAPTKLLPT